VLRVFKRGGHYRRDGRTERRTSKTPNAAYMLDDSKITPLGLIKNTIVNIDGKLFLLPGQIKWLIDWATYTVQPIRVASVVCIKDDWHIIPMQSYVAGAWIDLSSSTSSAAAAQQSLSHLKRYHIAAAAAATVIYLAACRKLGLKTPVAWPARRWGQAMPGIRLCSWRIYIRPPLYD